MQAQDHCQKTVLPNGIRVLTETIPSVRSISVGVWVFTGSRNEEPGESGISHFIEHMVFKGTKRRRMHQIARSLESVGGFINAFTGKEYTCYFARSLDEHLGRAIDVLCDLILEPTFPQKELSKEKDVVLEEIKMYEDVPDDLIFDRFESIIYRDHNLGRPVIGYPATVQSFTQSQLTHYLVNNYTAGKTVISVAGNVKHEQVVQLVEKAFSMISRPHIASLQREVNGYKPDEIVEERSIQQAHLVLGTRAIGMHDKQRIPLTVLNTILGGGMSSRLNQNIREKYGYCYNIYSFVNLHSDTGDFGIYMGTDPSKVKHAEKLILKELDKLAQKPVSKRLLNQAINQLKGSLMLGLESMTNRMMRLARQELYFERTFSLDEVMDAIEQVSAEQITDLASELFAPDNFSRIVFLPTIGDA